MLNGGHKQLSWEIRSTSKSFGRESWCIDRYFKSAMKVRGFLPACKLSRQCLSVPGKGEESGVKSVRLRSGS